jgi:magnesium chelatase family protein
MLSTFSRVYSAQPFQLQGHIVTVEVDITNGLHSFTIIGLPDKAVEESRDRVSSAIKNSDFVSPKQENFKTVVSLAPAELKKEGSYFDLAIALGYLLSSHNIDFDPEKKIFLGELSLNGEIGSVSGVLPLVQHAKNSGFTEIFVPAINAREAALVDGMTIYAISTLKQVVNHLTGKELLTPEPQTEINFQEIQTIATDFFDIKGQEIAKRGLEIAAAGGHNIVMYGPPGTGKTMLARAFTGILPILSLDEALEVTGIHSISGKLQQPLIIHPPFRAPHHTSSYVSLIGGGTIPKPGEATLAHRGVLFLDEFPEFETRVLESLRQPLEDRVVNISRAKGNATFPSQFILIAAMNPCPCGNSGSLHKKCICTQNDVARYGRKISGPIMDRIDLWIPVEHIDYDKLGNQHNAEKSSEIKTRVKNAREKQHERFGTYKNLNAHMQSKDVERLLITDTARQTLNKSAQMMKLSPRAYHRMIKLARTIADLENSAEISEDHILEALQYRPKQN